MTAIEPRQIGIIEQDAHSTGLCYSPCGRILAAPAFDGSVRRWKMDSITGAGEKEFSLPEWTPVNGHNGFSSALAFHPHRLIAYSADSWGQLMAWPYLSEKAEPLWIEDQAHDGWIRELAMGSQGDWLVTCGRDKNVRIFASVDGSLLRNLEGHDDDVYVVAVHPSGKWIVSGDLRGRIIQWEVATGKIVKEFDATDFYLLHRLQDIAGVRKLSFDKDGNTLILSGGIPTGGGNVVGSARIRMWDFSSSKVKHDIEVGDKSKDVFAHDFALHPEGFIITATTGQPGQGNLILIQPGEKDPIYKSSKGTVNCHGVALSPDYKQFAVSTTSKGSNGNGRRLDADGKYPNNSSPIYLFSLEKVPKTVGEKA